ncbi:MAG: DUF6455 family protein [Paracoccaceae bacterium]|nr:DUF6455 family protein [Paracoccaceae bacterium]
MIGYVEAPQAWWLAHGMARSIGVSLPHAVLEGWLTRRELGVMVSRCQSCGKSLDCTSWLAQANGRRSLPVFCGNKADLEALSPEA